MKFRKDKNVEVEQTEQKKVNKALSSNRAMSIILLCISCVLIIVSVKIIVDFVMVNNERNDLVAMKEQLLKEREEYKSINSHLGDEYYYDIYVREEYQFQGDDVIRVTK